MRDIHIVTFNQQLLEQELVEKARVLSWLQSASSPMEGTKTHTYGFFKVNVNLGLFK